MSMHDSSRHSVTPRFAAIDLFAGAGGFSLGFEWSDIRVQAAIELDPWACETYATNFPDTKVVCADIETLSNETLQSLCSGTIDIVLGGPPCQGFSHSNIRNRDRADPRNSLFQQFIRFVELARPRACLIENVRGLLTSVTASDEPVIDLIHGEFARIGYSASHKLLNALHFGVPQNRERLFVVAFPAEDDTPFAWPAAQYAPMSAGETALFPDDLPPYVTLWDAISDLPQPSDGIPTDCYATSAVNPFQQRMRERHFAITNHEPMRHTKRIVERFTSIGYGQSEASVAVNHAPRKRGTGNKGTGTAYSQNSRRQHPNRPCNTVVASSHTNFIHPYEHRNFTVRELARIQSFPDWFVFRGKRAVLSKKLAERKGLVADLCLDQRMQVGNAVPPLLALALAGAIKKHVTQGHSRTTSH
jgi:DNA (cytosine-5)-methyltransferase 1